MSGRKWKKTRTNLKQQVAEHIPRLNVIKEKGTQPTTM